MEEIPGITSISINVNKEKTNRILGDTCRTIWGRDTITDYIGNVKYQISPLSFYQVNPEQTEKLYNKALEYADLHGDETVWDLYCGIGTISISWRSTSRSSPAARPSWTPTAARAPSRSCWRRRQRR